MGRPDVRPEARTGRLRVGTSGYQYEHWRGRFYPPELPKDEWLTFYSARFDTVEINRTFYGLPTASTFDAWRRLAPKDFIYALKFSRYGSHMKHLKDPEDTIGRFLQLAEHLEDTLGPILVQLPPKWNANARRLAAFLEAAPARCRWAVEFRNPTWLCEDVLEILRNHRVALCLHDMIPRHPAVATTDWAYTRFHGPAPGGRYGRRGLAAFGRVIEDFLGEGLDVFAYFNNDAHGHAVRDASLLRQLLEPWAHIEGGNE
jgi:uncharacterized protein YecE (DUF72 family)